MSQKELFGQVVTINSIPNNTGCDDQYCGGYQHWNQCNPDDR
mgnify:CR=1 FL=1